MSLFQDTYDVIVVGAGPAGIGVSVVLKKMGLNFIILEKDEIGNWVTEELFDTEKVYIKSDFPDLAIILDSIDFSKHLKFQNILKSKFLS